MSRRTFVQLSVGTVAVLPMISHGVFATGLPPRAYADERVANSNPVKIVVVSPKQVGFYVVDQAGEKDTPIPGAHVVLSSRYNSKVVEGDTGENGIVLLDIEELAEEELTDGRYCFNGSIDITAEGFREFHILLARIEGGTPLSVPTRKIEPNRPYPSRVSFDEWDILYTKTGFACTPANSDTHEIAVEIRDLGEKATLILCSADGKKDYASTSLNPQNGVATASFKKAFLHKGKADCLPISDSFGMKIETSQYTYSFPLALDVQLGAVDALGTAPGYDVDPGNSTVPTGQIINMPDWASPTCGQTLEIWTPKWFLVPVVDPFGFVYLAWQSARFGYVNDDGTTSPNQWGSNSYGSFQDQWDKFNKKIDDMQKKVDQAMKDPEFLKCVSFTPQYSAYVQFRIAGQAKWDWQTKHFNGALMFQLLGHVGVGFSGLWVLGVLPLYIDFMLNLDVVVQILGVGITTPDALDISKYTWDLTNTGSSFTFTLSPVCSVGAGIPGFFAVGMRGYASISYFIGSSSDGKPHRIVGLVGYAGVEVQLFLAKWTQKLWNYNEPRFYDNYRDQVLMQGEPAPAEDPGWFKLVDGSYSPLRTDAQLASDGKDRMWTAVIEDAAPVTAAELLKSNELRLTGGNAESPTYDLGQVQKIAASDSFVGARLYPWDTALTEGLFWDEQVVKEPIGFRVPEGKTIAGIHEQFGGVKPANDDNIVKDMFSDARVKAHYLEGDGEEAKFIFRIASVEVDGQVRTQLVYQHEYRWTLSSPRTVQFATGIDGVSRDDLYDYDFDMSISRDGKKLSILLLSDKRESLDAVPDSYENMYFTYLECSLTAAYGVGQWRSFTWHAPNNSEEGVRNVFFCPRILRLEGQYGAGNSSSAAFAWMHRSSTGEDGLLQSADARVALGVGFACDEGIVLCDQESAVLPDSTVHDMSLLPGDFAYPENTFDLHLIARGTTGSTCAYVPVSVASKTPRVGTTQVKGVFEGLITHLTPWPGVGHNGFLATHNKRLVNVVPAPASDEGLLNIAELGSFDIDVDSLGIDPEGIYVYFPSNRNGQGETEFDEDGNPKKVSFKDNRIMASKLQNGVFCDPYVFCHVDHPIESLTAVKEHLRAMAFFCTEITDFANSKASIWYTSVPSVVCPTITDAELLTPLVSAGDYVHFLLVIRNDGNTHIKGATATLIDEQGNEVSSGKIEFTEETRQVSVWNPPEGMEPGDEALLSTTPITKTALRTGETVNTVAVPADNRSTYPASRTVVARASVPHAEGGAKMLTLGEDASKANSGAGGTQDSVLSVFEKGVGLDEFELAPGKKAVYAVALPVPEDWSGERTVTVGLRDVRYVGVAEVASDSDPLVLENMSTVKDASLLAVSASVGADHDVNQDAPVSMYAKNQDDHGSDGKDDEKSSTNVVPKSNTVPKAGTSGSSSKITPTATAKTDDVVPVGGVAALAFGAASAGLLAYSARRQANEEAEADEA